MRRMRIEIPIFDIGAVVLAYYQHPYLAAIALLLGSVRFD